MFYTANEIFEAVSPVKPGVKAASILTNWPFIVGALIEFGIDTRWTEAAAAATVAIETGSFKPIKEIRASETKNPKIFQLQQRYYPSGFYGRGYIQLTWDYNYKEYGKALGLPLAQQPDLALDPVVAARILALYFKKRKINELAEAQNWVAVRKAVNGGTYHLDLLKQIIKNLGGQV